MSRISEKLSESQMILRKNAASSAKKSMATNKQVESSHPDCPFCNVQFIGLEFDEEQQIKKNLIKKGAFKAENKEEEYFRMCLLSFQLNYKHNQKIMTLDHKALYKTASIQKKMPFFKWNKWISDQVQMLEFEYIYKKKTEFEYSKILEQKYQIKDTYF